MVMMKASAAIGLACLASLGLAQGLDLPQKVTLTLPATRVKPAVAALAKAGNANLDVAPNISGEVILVDVKDIPLQDLLQRIAQVTSCKWSKEGGTLRLVADTDKRQAEELDSKRQRVARMAKSIESMLNPIKVDPNFKKTLDSSPDMPAETTQTSTQRTFANPMGRAIARFVAATGAPTLANINEGGRAVFSSAPTRMQRAMVPGSAAIIASLIRDQNVMIAAEQAAQKAAPPKNEEDTVPVSSEPIENPSKVLFIVSRSRGSESLSVTLRLYDATGGVIAEQADGVNAVVESPTTEVKDIPNAKEKIVLNPESQALVSLIGSFSNFGMDMGKNPVLFKAMERPTEFDPLRLLVSDGAIAVGKAYGKPVVASLPDNTMQFFDGGPSLDLTVGSFIKNMGKAEVVMSTNDNWVTLKPSDPAKARRERVDRFALEKLTQPSDRLLPTLDDLASFLSSTPSLSTEFGISTLYLAFRVPGAMMYFAGSAGMGDTLRFYGTLSIGQRQALNQGGKVAFATMSPAQRDLVNMMVYGADGRLLIEDPDVKEKPSGLSGLMEDMEDSMPFMGFAGGYSQSTGDYRSEPTEAFPSGLPGDGFLEVESKTQEAILGEATDLFSVMMGSMSASQLGAWSGMGAGFVGQGMPDPFGPNTKYRFGSKSVFKFNFRLSPLASVKGALQEQNFSRASVPVPYAQLAEAFRKKVEEAKAKMKEQMSEMGGGDEPPPPVR